MFTIYKNNGHLEFCMLIELAIDRVSITYSWFEEIKNRDAWEVSKDLDKTAYLLEKLPVEPVNCFIDVVEGYVLKQGQDKVSA